MQSNPYVDSFPRGSPISPYAQSNVKNTKIERTTKFTGKLVLLPDELSYSKVELPIPTELYSTTAEQSLKGKRSHLPRVTSITCADSLKLDAIQKFLKAIHGVNGIVYDECLYASYEVATRLAVLGCSNNAISHMTAERIYDQPHTPIFTSMESLDNIPETTETENTTEEKAVPFWMFRSEVFFFDYGVMVLWNFSEDEEQKFVQMIHRFCVDPIPLEDIEVDELHFQYDLHSQKPRIYNDIITLKGSNPLIRLTISHGLAQSVKLSVFEIKMEETIEDTIQLPQQMAKYGQINTERTSVLKIVGELFDLRMNVNLVSNVLDTPEIFWSEPELTGLYIATRSILFFNLAYFEISQRASLLNKRVEVVSDLLDMLSDHQDFGEKTHITWIVVFLVAGCVVVAILEVWVKIVRLQGEKNHS